MLYCLLQTVKIDNCLCVSITLDMLFLLPLSVLLSVLLNYSVNSQQQLPASEVINSFAICLIFFEILQMTSLSEH